MDMTCSIHVRDAKFWTIWSFCVKVKETDKWGDKDVDGNIIKMDPNEVGCEDVHLTYLMQDKGQCR
jgi:hypothetical protein